MLARKTLLNGEQEIEKQTELEEAAEVGVLSASGSVGGLNVHIDQAAIQLARQVMRFSVVARFFFSRMVYPALICPRWQR